MDENTARELLATMTEADKRVLLLILQSKDIDKAIEIAQECVRAATTQDSPLRDADIPEIAKRIAEST